MNLHRNKLFWIGLALRLMLVAVLLPRIHEEWFVPFLLHVDVQNWFDPWTSFRQSGGDDLAFPYGLPYLVLAPLTMLVSSLGDLFGLSAVAAGSIGLGLSIIALEIALVVSLCRFGVSENQVLAFYWLSPVCLYISYIHGQLDVIPTLLVFTAVVWIRWRNYRYAGAAFGTAIAAKLSAMLALPVFAALFVRNVRHSRGLLDFALAAGVAAAVFLGAALLSPGFAEMALGSPEFRKLFLLSVRIGEAQLYITPVLYVAFLYFMWRLRRVSMELFVNLLGAAFLGLLIVTPASPGWFYWAIPFLVIYQASHGPSAAFLVQGFLGTVLIRNLFVSSGASFRFDWPTVNYWSLPEFPSVQSVPIHLLDTLQYALAIILLAQMVRELILKNHDVRIARKPLLIGIAGDSGTGKDTLVHAMTKALAEYRVRHISGDDYHLWDRNGSAWKFTTHLNPYANDLHQLSEDVLNLSRGQSIRKRHYDHSTGMMTRPMTVGPGDLIMVSGLHALTPLDVRRKYDLLIYLDMDEDLRRFYKVRRDVNRRGHSVAQITESIERRMQDSERFVKPQRELAHIVFRLASAEPLPSPEEAVTAEEPYLQLTVSVQSGIQMERLAQALVAVCGLSVFDQSVENGRRREITIDGFASQASIAAAAFATIPEFIERNGDACEWEDGFLGIMQLISVAVLIQLGQRVR